MENFITPLFIVIVLALCWFFTTHPVPRKGEIDEDEEYWGL